MKKLFLLTIIVLFLIISLVSAEELIETKIGETILIKGTFSYSYLIYSGMIGKDTFVIVETTYRNTIPYYFLTSEIPFQTRIGKWNTFYIEIIDVKPHKITYKIK